MSNWMFSIHFSSCVHHMMDLIVISEWRFKNLRVCQLQFAMRLWERERSTRRRGKREIVEEEELSDSRCGCGAHNDVEAEIWAGLSGLKKSWARARVEIDETVVALMEARAFGVVWASSSGGSGWFWGVGCAIEQRERRRLQVIENMWWIPWCSEKRGRWLVAGHGPDLG